MVPLPTYAAQDRLLQEIRTQHGNEIEVRDLNDRLLRIERLGK